MTSSGISSTPQAIAAERQMPTIGILCHSIIADDPRVRKQGDAFSAAGWSVVGIGLSGARSKSPYWRVAEVSPENWPVRNRYHHNFRILSGLAAGGLHFKALPVIYGLYPGLYPMYVEARRHRPDLWLANDWPALTIAEILSKEQDVPFAYDTHELASQESPQSWRWQITRRPLVKLVEGNGIRSAALVSCVSHGISKQLQKTYGLERSPLVVRNVPFFQANNQPLTSKDSIRVLYHGIVASGRGLEETIKSVKGWRHNFHLTIRGPCTDQYKEQLCRLIRGHDVANRITIAPPVPMTGLVEAASCFDIGIFALDDNSLQNTYALPNKLFEYIMAGLAVCVSDLPEMAKIVNDYNVGILIEGASALKISKAVNGFDETLLLRYKENARAASRTLNWQIECSPFVQACSAVIGHRPKETSEL